MLEVRNLKCGYKHKTHIEVGSHSFSERGLTFIVGPNGAGKSTFLRTLAGAIAPTEGQVLFNNALLSDGVLPDQRPAFLPARNSIQQGVTGRDLLELFHAKGSRWHNAEDLHALNIEALLKKPLDQLSSGEAQRVILGAVLSHPSSTVILDEPLTHLDWSFSFQLHAILDRMHSTGRTFVISSHDLNWCLQFPSSQTWALANGRVIVKAPTPEALTHPALQEAFNFRSQIADNPLNKTQLLALAAYDRKRESKR